MTDENRISELIDAGLYRQKQETTIMEITETKESKEKREGIIKNMLIAFYEDTKKPNDMKKTPSGIIDAQIANSKILEKWARKIISEVEQN